MDFNIIILICLGIIAAGIIAALAVAMGMNSKIKLVARAIAAQNAAISKMRDALRDRAATGAIAENAEIVYQDLVQNLTPVMAELDIKPRDTAEHLLWRTLGGLIDEYGKNPFVLEQLRRSIKLNSAIARNADLFLAHADKLLRHLSAADTDGLLTATFTDGLLGQSVTLLTQAKQLAQS
ncbi:MAG: hypothetical protein FWC61_03785 [Proteobacteria bacterium]|nr:hypothetical protein [Pseudomonadota bacterium]